MAGVATLALAGTLAGILATSGGSQRAVRLAAGRPTGLSVEALRRYAATVRGGVYWRGAVDGQTLEVTRTAGGVYVRYLPRGVKLGDRRPLFTTIGTFPLAHAYRVAGRDARRPGFVSRRVHGGIAVWRRSRPTSVYLASRGGDVLVEVYAANPRKARALALSGLVRPLR